MSNPEVIVIAEQPVYDVLAASGVDWNLQTRVSSVAEMWDGLSNGTLSQGSSILFFSDSIAVTEEGELETAIATMAPHSTVFIAAWHTDGANALQGRIKAAAASMGLDGPFYFVPLHDEKSFLNGVRTVVEGHTTTKVTFPETWGPDIGGIFHGNVDGPAPDEYHDEPVTPALEVAVEVAPEPVTIELAPEPVTVEVVPAVGPPLAPQPVPLAPEPVPVTPTPVAPAPQPEAPAPLAPRVPLGAAPVQPVGPVSPVGPVTSTAPALAPRPAPVATQPTQAPSAREDGGPLDGYKAPATNSTLTFFSSKGGSGKSTTALMTATTIAHCSEQAGKPLKVVLVDMDTRDGQVASLIGMYAPTALNIRVAEDWNEETVLKNLVHSDKLKIDCLLAPIRPRTADDVGPDFYRHVIRILQKTHDVVIMDCSVNYLDPLISTVCLPEAKAVLFVTTMATTAVQGMARALREITEPLDRGGMGIPRSKIGIVVNQSVQNVGLDKEQVTQAALSVPLVGAIPLATTDVLKATNGNKMHFLIKHPILGPAYTRLARVCLPEADLRDLPGVPSGAGQHAPTPIVAPRQAMDPNQHVAEAQHSVAPPVAGPVDESGKKVGRRLLGRKKD